ncbi:MAG: sigma-70 family RNA polymerase sigma factor [Myxococcota bacterium]
MTTADAWIYPGEVTLGRDQRVSIPRRRLPPPSDEVINLAREGNAEARGALLATWVPVVLAWCSRLGGPRVDPDDAAQDVWMVALRRLDQLHRAEIFASWMFGITRRVLAQHRRRVWGRRRSPLDVESMVHEEGSRAGAHRAEIRRKVWEVLVSLPLKQRETLVLMDLEGWSTREVAEMTGVPSGTVASRLRLARQRFERTARARGLAQLLEAEQ